MEFISEYGLFLLKAITIVIAILAAVSGIVSLTMRQHAGKQDETLELTDINEKYEAMNSALKQALLDPGAQKLAAKAEKKKRKAEPNPGGTSGSNGKHQPARPECEDDG